MKRLSEPPRTRGAAHSHLTALIGKADDLPTADLPTRRNVLQALIKERLTDTRDIRNIPIMEMAGKIGRTVSSKWLEINHKMKNVMVQPKEVSRRVLVLWQKLEDTASGGKKKKAVKRKKKGQAEKEKEEFVNSLDKLFDICSCHCQISLCSDISCQKNCQPKVHIQCTCSSGRKIPLLELEFMHDQREKTGAHGKVQIGLKDGVESARQGKALAREELLQQRVKNREEKIAKEVNEQLDRKLRCEEQEQGSIMVEGEDPGDQVEVLGEWDGEVKGDQDFLSPGGALLGASRTSASGKWSGAQNRQHFPRTVMAAMRGNVSQRTLANILSSYAVDMGLATREDPSLLVDHSKVSREVESQMARITANAEEWMRTSGIDAVQFDGKDEVSKAWVTLDDGTKVIRHVKEDHITLTDAEGEFLMHFTREKVEGVKAARVVAIKIITFLRLFGIDATLKLIGADSTNMNTGCKEGSIVILERLLGRRLVWSICLLHTNELPLRHLIAELDGPTGSGNSFIGPAGKLLPITQTLPYNPDFTPLSVVSLSLCCLLSRWQI